MVRSSFSSRIFSWLAWAALCLGSAGFGLQHAMAQVPSADQIEIFTKLTPAPQQALLDSMNRGSTTGPTNRPRADRPLRFPETVRPRTSPDEGGEETAQDTHTGGAARAPR